MPTINTIPVADVLVQSRDEGLTVEIDTEKIDETVLALLYLTPHDGARDWKSLDWETLNRLPAKGLIADPASKNKSVALTDEGLPASERLFGQLFVKH